MLYDEKYWKERFSGNEPPIVRVAIKRIYNAYPKECMPQGLSDPMYIMNTICMVLEIGDGKGNFTILNPEKVFAEIQGLRSKYGMMPEQDSDYMRGYMSALDAVERRLKNHVV